MSNIQEFLKGLREISNDYLTSVVLWNDDLLELKNKSQYKSKVNPYVEIRIEHLDTEEFFAFDIDLKENTFQTFPEDLIDDCKIFEVLRYYNYIKDNVDIIAEFFREVYKQ